MLGVGERRLRRVLILYQGECAGMTWTLCYAAPAPFILSSVREVVHYVHSQALMSVQDEQVSRACVRMLIVGEEAEMAFVVLIVRGCRLQAWDVFRPDNLYLKTRTLECFRSDNTDWHYQWEWLPKAVACHGRVS